MQTWRVQKPALFAQKTGAKAKGLTQQQTEKIIAIQQRKAIVDLEYMLMVGEMVKELRQALDNGLGDECCDEVLGVPRLRHRYEAIYDIKQACPELNQSSAEAWRCGILLMQASRQSYELKEEEKRAIITQARRSEEITEKAIADLKKALEHKALEEQTKAVDEAVEAARAGDAEALKALADERKKLKEDMAKLLNELRETRAKLPKDATSAEVAEATVNLPEPGSVIDRVTPPLSFLRDDPVGQSRIKRHAIH